MNQHHEPARVLVTGVSNPLGAEVARRLAGRVPFLFGCDVADPVSAVEGMDFVHADTRHTTIGKLIRQLRIDTVVHLAVLVDAPRDDRTIHETNVIGTMNVLVGCMAPAGRVQRLVVKSSQAVYGASSTDPSFLSEDISLAERSAPSVTRDLVEMEQLVNEFALRNERTPTIILRLGYRLGSGSSLARYLSFPAVATFAGYDPRLQFLHESDAAEALVRATMGGSSGICNVTGEGIVLLSQAISVMGGRPLPVLMPYGRLLARMALRMAAGVNLPAHIADVLVHGSVMDCTRFATAFGWRPEHTSRGALDAFAKGAADDELLDVPSPPQEFELQGYLQRRRRAVLADGAAARVRT